MHDQATTWSLSRCHMGLNNIDWPQVVNIVFAALVSAALSGWISFRLGKRHGEDSKIFDAEYEQFKAFFDSMQHFADQRKRYTSWLYRARRRLRRTAPSSSQKGLPPWLVDYIEDTGRALGAASESNPFYEEPPLSE